MDNLSNISTIKQLLGDAGFTFKKSLGQNFLINPNVCPRMAEESCCPYTDSGNKVGALEIGPGIGVLTVQLSALAEKVVAIELDERLKPVLNKTLSDCSNTEVIYADAMKLDLSSLITEKFSGMKVVVCANLPYYITSPLVMKLLEDRLPVESITVMVQKEAAERLCAKVGSRAAGAVTAAVAYYAEAEILFAVSAGSFMPPPKVDSSVIRLNVLKSPPVAVIDEAFFFSVIKAAFAQRRKTLVNSVSSSLNIPKEKIAEALIKTGLSTDIRAERLTLVQFAGLSDLLFV